MWQPDRQGTLPPLPLDPLSPETLKWRPAIDAANGDTLLADCTQNFVPLYMLGFPQPEEDLYEKETVYGRTEGRRERVCDTEGQAVCVYWGSGVNRTLHAQEHRRTWVIDSQEIEGDRVVGQTI